MKMRRFSIVGLSLLAAVSLAVGGCAKNGTDGSSAGAASSGAKDAKGVLTASIAQLAKTTYEYSLDSGGTSSHGLADPVKKSLTLTLAVAAGTGKANLDFVIIGTGYWLKMDLGKDAAALGIPSDKYMRLDSAKFGDDSMLNGLWSGVDMASGLFAGLTDVQRVDGQHLTGTIDLTKVGNGAAPSSDALAQAGDKAKSAPFAAVLDSQGRLTSFKVDMAAVGVDELLDMTYSNYGTSAAIGEPAASETVDAPSSVYDLFGSTASPSASPSTN